MYIVMYIGCLECGAETAVYGCYTNREDAVRRVNAIVAHDGYATVDDFNIVPVEVDTDTKVVVIEEL
jgi:hypothetical protein